MNKNSSTLKKYKDELEVLKKDLPRLKAVADDAEAKFANSRQGRPVYPRDQISPYSSAKARIDALSQEIPSLQRLVNWEEGVEFASKNLNLAKKDMARVQGEIKNLLKKREVLESKRMNLLAKHEQDFKAAQRDEHDAAQAYAHALGEGDNGVENKAEGLLQKASQALAVMKQTLKGANTVSSALSIQISQFDETIKEKQSGLEDLKTKTVQAARFYWADRFETFARELTNLAAFVSASEELLGYGDSLADYYIPNISPGVNNSVSNHEVKKQRKNIKLEDLINI